MAKYEIVMVRHGESQWNQQNLFCGWFDADLSEAGIAEAAAAGQALKSEIFPLEFFLKLVRCQLQIRRCSHLAPPTG